MTNLTISIDEAVVRQARVRAIQEGTSVSAKVRDFLAKDGDVYRVYESDGTDNDVVDRSASAALTATAGGYQLAMRDMEIRGVGNLLGVEQSGQMETIGFDLYMEMLQECLAEIQGQDIPRVDDTQIDPQAARHLVLRCLGKGAWQVACTAHPR